MLTANYKSTTANYKWFTSNIKSFKAKTNCSQQIQIPAANTNTVTVKRRLWTADCRLRTRGKSRLRVKCRLQTKDKMQARG